MKSTLVIIIIIITLTTISYGQNYKKADSIALSYPEKFSAPEKLAKRISKDFQNDFEKIRALYTWIANNVVYDPTESGKFLYEYSNKREYEKKDKKFNNKLSNRVISKKKAVCQGYATLFKKVCDELNIKSKYVSGASKTKIKHIGNRYFSNHAWNIVLIENKEYLIDVTWGAGTYSNHFEKRLNYFYFLTDPKLFIKKHYPDYFENAALKEKIKKEDFLNAPLVYNYDYELIHPKTGTIKKNESEKVKFIFSTEKKVSSVTYKLNKDSYPINSFIYNNNILEFDIELSRFQRANELTLFFDYKSVIGFKIK
ncbi:transglutaminase domain-containing protein [Flavivirga aquimarina]|uniref:Transglutaminase domain-containing protein n=1 Tax=Flavivirga aquimarina TaxID=2027862 RepID=A0ABT8WAQ4_9FLAO|nr:transglutaminase domain-containing protein [Flavivirga aquimarina]MDO5970228.1 transglutaminase domain-containing protein [Flavivirga aquimarina]